MVNDMPIENSRGPSLPEKGVIDESYYDLDKEEAAFFKSQTGIQDDEALKQHILKIQVDAYDVRPYPCIFSLAFTKLKISRLPAYGQVLQLGKEREGAILLDIGCCFGNDVRKAIADGFPAHNVIASDLEPEFWKLAYRLFNDSPETFPVPLIPGDVFDVSFLKPIPPFQSLPETPVPSLSTLTNLTPLLGHVSVIHASSLFHLFDEAHQFQLAQSLAGLLSPLPGSLIFGSHAAWPEKGLQADKKGLVVFCHSIDSWTEIWDGQIFLKGTVKVDAELREIQRRDLDRKFWLMEWSVTRL